MGNFEAILYEKKGGIAYITLNRPRVLNAYNVQMRDDIYQVLEAVDEDSEVRVVILRGAGEKAFCVGADLTEFGTAPSKVVARKVKWERDVWGRFLALDKPIIVGVHGYVLGSGLEMALCCDIRIAARDAQFGLPEVSLGMIPAAGGTQTLPRIVGRSKALEMLLDGRYMDASEALRIGLVHRVVPRGKLAAETEKVARRLVSYNALALKYAKRAIAGGLDMSLAEGLELENRLAIMAMTQ